MNTEEAKEYCLSLADVTQAETKDGKWTVFMKADYVFMLIVHSDIFHSITIRLSKDKGEKLQDEYNIVSDSILNIDGWYDIELGYNFLDKEIKSWIAESYDLISKDLKSEEQEKYRSLAKTLGLD